MNKIAIYAGSFDPPTLGHFNIIKKSVNLFDKLIIAVGDNPKKSYMFSGEERVELIKKSIKLEYPEIYSKVEVEYFKSKFLINYAEERNANYIIRGIRNESDYKDEKELFVFNKRTNNNIENIYLMPDLSVEYISSSLIKNSIGYINWQYEIEDKLTKFVFFKLNEKVFSKLFNETINKMKMYGIIDNYHTKLINNALLEYYSPIRRSYHNINHIIYMIELSNTVYVESEIDRTLLEYSIFFHDFFDELVYGTDAIYKSADISIKLMGNANIKYKTIIKKLINSTDYSKRFGFKNKLDYTYLQKIIMDLDFSAMGRSEDIYLKISSKLYNEYMKSVINDDDITGDRETKEFYNARKEFLKSIKGEQIFLTNHFKSLEKNVKHNIHNEYISLL